MSNQVQEKFEYWLFEMDDALDCFLESLPSNTRSSLDFSPASLDAIESWLLSTYDSVQSVKQPDQAAILDGAARYIGETFRRNLGGKWMIETSDSDYVFFGIPTLSGCRGQQTSLCPLALATASVDRRRGNYLRTIFENMLKNTAEN